MSIKGIDAQIMINRLPDYAREASSLYKRAEVFQDHIARQTKITDAQEQSKVTKMKESDLEKLILDDEGGGSGGGGEEDMSGSSEDAHSTDDMMVPSEDHVIDIRV